ncbi:hypothetical protein SCHPADRAFT_892898 [Schizopora paradoxa]|uniref:Uncharacterized protein n=1 Tax=Schizopora paradoxa TaxID=27342 RepID=A0A0H2RD41_9AGAM|nr:hypothetical protein SCHPADRAFT_892898 [Schizopora paradoxa]
MNWQSFRMDKIKKRRGMSIPQLIRLPYVKFDTRLGVGEDLKNVRLACDSCSQDRNNVPSHKAQIKSTWMTDFSVERWGIVGVLNTGHSVVLSVATWLLVEKLTYLQDKSRKNKRLQGENAIDLFLVDDGVDAQGQHVSSFARAGLWEERAADEMGIWIIAESSLPLKDLQTGV